MQITELLRLTDWFQNNIVKSGLPSKYTALFNKMNSNIRRNVNQPLIPFEIEKESLFEDIKKIKFDSLSLEQINFLEKLGVVDLLGNEGVIRIQNILYKNNLDIASASARIKEFVDTINKAQTTIKELQDTLTKSFEIDVDSEIPENTVLMRVYFQNEMSIDNLTDFKKFSALWYDIGRGIAMAQDKSPEDFNIIGAKKGSIILEMAVVVGLAKTVSVILVESLKVAERVLEILRKVEELKSLKLNNKKIELELKKEADKEKEEGIKHILDNTITELNLNVTQQGDKITAIEKSIKKLIDFTQKGGMVDFVQPDESNFTEDEENMRDEVSQLKENISKIRLLEDKVKLLEARKL